MGIGFILRSLDNTASKSCCSTSTSFFFVSNLETYPLRIGLKSKSASPIISPWTETSQVETAHGATFYPLNRQRKHHSAEKVEGESDSTVCHESQTPLALDFGEVVRPLFPVGRVRKLGRAAVQPV